MQDALRSLADAMDGELHYDQLMRTLYATDASVYRQLPLAVALPQSTKDLQALVNFAHRHKTALIPRAAGTSLAGQCVGDGIVVDTGRYMNRILELNVEEGWVRVQPGVIRDELNAFLAPHRLFFGPNTSTANRCMIGGMVGNNSCGTTSIVYGSTREHVLEMDVVLSDGSTATFGPLSEEGFRQKLEGNTLENKVYQHIWETLSQPDHQAEIRREFPRPSIDRRNTGYAVDLLLRQPPFSASDQPFNFCTLLCGSEGTLALTTSVKLSLVPTPPPHDVVLCAHFNSVHESMQAVLVAMEHHPTACELMDKVILDCTRDNIEQRRNRFFIEGDPAAVLMVEFRADDPQVAQQQARILEQALKGAGLGYAYPVVDGQHTNRVWTLRKAGLGLLSNIKGDKKPVACIEDTAVDIRDLPDYIEEFDRMLDGFGQQAVYYAHAGAGELHLRPMLNLKTAEDQQHFHDITEATARLVKKYGGSLSGEHGDGRVRAPFLPLMVGQRNYELLRQVKQNWDPLNIFNPGKIIDPAPVTDDLRYTAGQQDRELSTFLDWTSDGSMLLAVERCNGSGDCRKLAVSGGTMCPSYRATRNEKDTTRGRANVLREFLTQSPKENPFDHPEIGEALDLCLSCKACKAECPSSVDMATMKAEFQYQYQKVHGTSLRTRAIANLGQLNGLGMTAPWLTNAMLSNSVFGGSLKKILGIAPERSLPRLSRFSLRRWYQRHYRSLQPKGPTKSKVYFFCDEFTNYNDAEMGRKCLWLLAELGYQVIIPEHAGSGRAHLSKGLLEQARELAEQNVQQIGHLITKETPLLGIEPSAILSFRDEYPRLVRSHLRPEAERIAPHALLLEDFLLREWSKGHINPNRFTDESARILVHAHCHQKAIEGPDASVHVLGIPENYHPELIPAGCCGMAGSFGYEKEHYDLSMTIGEETLLPAVRQAAENTLIAAPGTSCRHQILDGTGRKAYHPVALLYHALRSSRAVLPDKKSLA